MILASDRFHLLPVKPAMSKDVVHVATTEHFPCVSRLSLFVSLNDRGHRHAVRIAQKNRVAAEPDCLLPAVALLIVLALPELGTVFRRRHSAAERL